MAEQPNGLLRKLGGQADPIYVGLYRAALSVAIALIGWFATTTWTEVREDLRALRNTLHAIDTPCRSRSAGRSSSSVAST